MFYLGVAGAMLLLLLGLAAWGLAVGGRDLSPLESLLLPPLALLGVWALAMWAVGSLIFNGTVAAATLVFLVALGASHARGEGALDRGRQRARSLLQSVRSLRRGELAAAFFVGAACTLTLLQALAPPSSGDYDSLVYHLAAPWRYVRAGRVLELPYDHHTYFPFAFEMLFAAPLSWFGLGLSSSAPAGGAVAAKILHWAMLPMSALLLVAFGSRVLRSRASGLCSAALWCSLPVVLNEASTAYIDLGLCAWVLAAFHCAARALADDIEQKEKRAWILWAGAFTGAALASKYLGALYAALLWAWLLGALLIPMLIPRLRRKASASAPASSSSMPWKTCAVGLGLMFVIGGGVYARNIAWTGSPVFPFAYEIFGGRGWELDMARAYSRDQASFGFGRSPDDWILLPWRLSMTPFNVGASSTGIAQGLPLWPLSSAPLDEAARNGLFETRGALLTTIIGPMLLALGLPTVLMRGKPRALGAWMLVVGALWIFWGATGQYARYLLPALAMWCAACGWGAVQLAPRRGLQVLVSGALVVWGLSSLLLVSRFGGGSWDVVLGRQEPAVWLARSFGGWRAMQWINTKTPPATGVAVWGESRCLYLDRPYLWADDPHNNLIDYKTLRDWPTLRAALRERGLTWVLWNVEPEKNAGFGGPPPEVARLIEQNASLKFEANGYRVYELE